MKCSADKARQRAKPTNGTSLACLPLSATLRTPYKGTILRAGGEKQRAAPRAAPFESQFEPTRYTTRLSMNDATMTTANTVNSIRCVRSRRWWPAETWRAFLRFAIAAWIIPQHLAE